MAPGVARTSQSHSDRFLSWVIGFWFLIGICCRFCSWICFDLVDDIQHCRADMSCLVSTVQYCVPADFQKIAEFHFEDAEGKFNIKNVSTWAAVAASEAAR